MALSFENRLKYYQKYLDNITPSDFDVKLEGKTIIVSLPDINENIYNRNEMPQIRKKNLPFVISDLFNSGIGLSYGKILPHRCKPLQKQIYKSKMMDVVNTLLDKGTGTVKPIIISGDNYIIDGHHRWGAFLTKFPNHPVNFVRIKKPKHTALNIYNKMSKRYD